MACAQREVESAAVRAGGVRGARRSAKNRLYYDVVLPVLVRIQHASASFGSNAGASAVAALGARAAPAAPLLVDVRRFFFWRTWPDGRGALGDDDADDDDDDATAAAAEPLSSAGAAPTASSRDASVSRSAPSAKRTV